MNKLALQKMANEVRKGIVTSVHAAKAGHPGGSLSAADIFTYLYFEELNVDPANPRKEVVTVLCYLKVILLRDYTVHWLIEDSFR